MVDLTPRAALFDLDDTLIEGRAAFDAALLTTCLSVEDDLGARHLAAAVLREARAMWWSLPGADAWRRSGVGSSKAPLVGDGTGCHESCRPFEAGIAGYREAVWSRALGTSTPRSSRGPTGQPARRPGAASLPGAHGRCP